VPSGCRHGRRPRRPELADIVRFAGPAFVGRRHRTGEQLAALAAISRCRTPAMGGHVEVCAACGRRRTVYRSCGNRHCPKCSTLAKERWLEARRNEVLPAGYFHVVFTLPHALNGLAQRRPREVYESLFRAASSTLLAFARDPDHLGATPGILAVLHTWTQTLDLHVHLHCVVTAGGLDATGRRWLKCRPGFLFPVRAMSRVFRAKYLEALAQALPSDVNADLDRRLRANDWVVYAKAPPAGPERLLEYLARYTHRVALTNDRLLGFDGRNVRLRWRDSAHGNRKRLMIISATDLLERFLRHVLPRGFKRVRHYGITAPACKAHQLALCRRYFGMPDPEALPLRARDLVARLGLDVTRCETCGSPKLRFEPLPPLRVPRARPP
jgi:hypothetical protein